MGLFGDRDVKKLEASMLTARVMLDMAVELGPTQMPNGRVMTIESVMNDVGNEVVPAARILAGKGRRDEAVARLEATRKTDGSNKALIWNEFLDQVLEHV
jgi:hypothetical protein